MKGMRPLTDDELVRLRDALGQSREAERNLTILAVGINSGFRISEILSLERSDVEETDGTVRDRVTVARKWMKGRRSSRSVIVSPALRQALQDWLDVMSTQGRTARRERLFLSERGTPLSRHQAWRMIRVACGAANIRGRVATHSMRKTYANRVYEHFLGRVAAGEPIDPFRATSKALGHSAITSTDRYLSFRQQDADAAVLAVQWPV